MVFGGISFFIMLSFRLNVAVGSIVTQSGHWQILYSIDSHTYPVGMKHQESQLYHRVHRPTMAQIMTVEFYI